MATPPRSLLFGEFTLDFERGELRHRGEFVEIQPTPLHVLLYLAAHRDRTVPRGELQDAIWPDVVVGDQALTTALSGARHAVGDDATSQRVIRTLKRQGYRFVVAAQEEREPSCELAAPQNIRAAAMGERAGRFARLGPAIVLAGVVAVGAAWGVFRTEDSAATSQPHALAVLPFRNASVDPAFDAFAGSLTARVADALQPPAHLIPVAPRVDDGASPREIGARLGATQVLRGTLLELGGRLRVTVELLSVEGPFPSWSETYDFPSDDLAAAQDAITNRVADEVPPFLPWARSDDLELAGRIAAIAHARGQIWSGDDEGALATLTDVVERNDDAGAHQLLAFAWVNLMNHGKRRPGEAIGRIRWHAEQAKRADPASIDARVAAALAALSVNDWDSAEREARAACDLDASPAVFGCLALRTALLAEGRAQESEEISRGQIDLFPYCGYAHFSLGKDLLAQGRFREAELEFRRAHALEPRGMSGPAGMSLGMAGLARNLDRGPDLEEFVQRLNDEVAAAEVRRIYLADGDPGVLRWLARRGDGEHGRASATGRGLTAAIAYALAGDDDQALAALESLPPMTDNGQYLVLPLFDRLRDTPRFRAVIEKLRLTAYHAKYLTRQHAPVRSAENPQ